MKGRFLSNGPRGEFNGDDPQLNDGANGIRVGDGFHDYLLAGFVSCNHVGVLPPNRRVLKARLRLHVSRVFGENKFCAPDPQAFIRVDMVRELQRACIHKPSRSCGIVQSRMRCPRVIFSHGQAAVTTTSIAWCLTCPPTRH